MNALHSLITLSGACTLTVMWNYTTFAAIFFLLTLTLQGICRRHWAGGGTCLHPQISES